MSENSVANKDTRAFLTYQRILPSFNDLILKQRSSVSDYWAEEVDGFSYMFEAPPSVINRLRHHCYHITGELPYKYRSHHNYNSNKYIYDNHIRPQNEFILNESKIFKLEEQGINQAIKYAINKNPFRIFNNKQLKKTKKNEFIDNQFLEIQEGIKNFYSEDYRILGY